MIIRVRTVSPLAIALTFPKSADQFLGVAERGAAAAPTFGLGSSARGPVLSRSNPGSKSVEREAPLGSVDFPSAYDNHFVFTYLNQENEFSKSN